MKYQAIIGDFGIVIGEVRNAVRVEVFYTSEKICEFHTLQINLVRGRLIVRLTLCVDCGYNQKIAVGRRITKSVPAIQRQ